MPLYLCLQIYRLFEVSGHVRCAVCISIRNFFGASLSYKYKQTLFEPVA